MKLFACRSKYELRSSLSGCISSSIFIQHVKERYRHLQKRQRRKQSAARPSSKRMSSLGVIVPETPSLATVKEKELRLALVCYGGISLAIYQHGVTKEILKLVRASKAYHTGTDQKEKQQATHTFKSIAGDSPEYSTEKSILIF
ncbi:hypothetical protein D3872_24805 [Massilia cavernae]|uniref:Uncharacterized protein n=2 Tax=Massilia cavernae TaxID=2320864 RepID=A0A418X775_9BURK|nr:hypothetical protein D3872_24805 [Massilia cavernae]